MAYIVGDACVNCKHTDCVQVCPVDCFYEGPNFLAIDPEVCIDCGLCEPECPVGAIYSEEEVPADQKNYIEINVTYSAKWPNITEVKESPADADKWAEVVGKEHLIEDWPEDK